MLTPKKSLLSLALSACLLCVLTAPAWAAVHRSLSVVYNDIKLVINGHPVTPKDVTGKVVEPFISEGTTYLPVRAVAEALGCYVEWYGEAQTVYVSNQNTGRGLALLDGQVYYTEVSDDYTAVKDRFPFTQFVYWAKPIDLTFGEIAVLTGPKVGEGIFPAAMPSLVEIINGAGEVTEVVLDSARYTDETHTIGINKVLHFNDEAVEFVFSKDEEDLGIFYLDYACRYDRATKHITVTDAWAVQTMPTTGEAALAITNDKEYIAKKIQAEQAWIDACEARMKKTG